MSTTPRNAIASFRRGIPIASGAAILGLIGLAAAFFTDRKAFYTSFMFAWAFWGGLSLGATTLTYLHHSIRAMWSSSISRVAEAANKLVFPMVILLLVVCGYGILNHELYQWSDPAVVHASELLQKKTWFLSAGGYIGGTLFCLVFWVVTLGYLNKSSLQHDVTKNERLGQERASVGAPVGVIHVVVLTAAVTYWFMSLDPVFYSTIYGAWFMIQELRCAIALGTIIVVGLRAFYPYSKIVTPNICRDLGWMLEGLTMFWAYVSLAQFLIIWSGNLPAEITFYNNRFAGALDALGGIIIVGQWLVPFLLLLSFNIKRKPEQLVPVAWLIFIFSAIDIWWQITPFFRVGMKMEYMTGYLYDLAAFVGIGGLWCVLFLGNLIKFGPDALIPLHDNRLEEEKRFMEAGHGH